MRARGRAKKSTVPRAEQLRRAKRAQRERQRAADIVEIQLALPRHVAAKLAAARRAAAFATDLDAALAQLVVRLADYPQLHDLAWNRVDEFIPAKEAFQLYERNWRFVLPGQLDERERQLIERLKTQFGGGEINA